MNNFFYLFCGMVLLIAATFNTGRAADTFTVEQLVAIDVLNRYFDATLQGDTVTMKALLGGQLLEKRIRLLDNPTYPQHLIDTYKNARFEVTRARTSNQHTVIIDAIIDLGGQDQSQKIYVLSNASPTSQGLSRFLITEEDDNRDNVR